MSEKKSRRSSRLLDVIAVILLIMAVVLTYMHHHVDFSNITAPFERMSSVSQQSEDSKDGASSGEDADTNDEKPDVVGSLSQTAKQMQDDLGLTKAQRNYIKFKTFMEELETRVTELPYWPLIVLALLFIFSIKSFIGIVPVSATCLIAPVIFPYPLALLINFIGVGIIFSIKYTIGYHSKSNALKKYIMKSDKLWEIVSDADNSTKEVLKESSKKRKAEREALQQLRKDEPKKTALQNPFLNFFYQIGKFFARIGRWVKNKLLKVPVLSILVDDEDPEASARGGTGNPIILFTLRLIPFVPANPVSSLYGNMKMRYRAFLTLSILGYIIKIISFTSVGANIADPFSSKFITPIIMLMYIAGFGLIAISFYLKSVDRRKKPASKNDQPVEAESDAI